MSTALVLQNKLSQLGDGLDNYSKEEQVIPQIKFDGKLGRFKSNIEETMHESLSVVMLWRKATRSFFDPDGDFGDKPACRSFNMKTAAPDSPNIQNGGDCTTCPKAQFNEELVDGRMVGVECPLKYSIMCLDTDNNLAPFILHVTSKSSVGKLKRVFSGIKNRGQQLASRVFTLSSKLNKEGQHSFFVMHAEHEAIDDDELLEAVISKFTTLQNLNEDDITEQKPTETSSQEEETFPPGNDDIPF